MTRNEEIIETLKFFYLLGGADGVANSLRGKTDIIFEKRLKEWWNGYGKKVFPDIELVFEEDMLPSSSG